MQGEPALSEFSFGAGGGRRARHVPARRCRKGQADGVPGRSSTIPGARRRRPTKLIPVLRAAGRRRLGQGSQPRRRGRGAPARWWRISAREFTITYRDHLEIELAGDSGRPSGGGASGGARGVGREAHRRTGRSGCTSATRWRFVHPRPRGCRPKVTSIRDVEWARVAQTGGFRLPVFVPGVPRARRRRTLRRRRSKGPDGGDAAVRAAFQHDLGRALSQRLGDRLSRGAGNHPRCDVEGDAGDHRGRRAGWLFSGGLIPDRGGGDEPSSSASTRRRCSRRSAPTPGPIARMLLAVRVRRARSSSRRVDRIISVGCGAIVLTWGVSRYALRDSVARPSPANHVAGVLLTAVLVAIHRRRPRAIDVLRNKPLRDAPGRVVAPWTWHCRAGALASSRSVMI